MQQLPKLSSLVDRIAGDGADAWAVHSAAKERFEAGEDVIVLSVGDPDFETPPAIVEAAYAALKNGRTHYTSVRGEAPLRARIAKQHERLTGQNVIPDQVVVVPGAQCALFSAVSCVLDQGEELLSPEPCYTTYEAAAGAAGGKLVTVPMNPQSAFRVDLQAMQKAVTPNTRGILLNTPGNPTGTVATAEEIAALGALCIEHDLWFLCDEVYASLTFEASHQSPAGRAELCNRVITISSLSKSHAMTGWRIGWAVAPLEVAQHMENLSLCMLYGSPPFVQDAACVALDDLDAVEQHRLETLRRRDAMFGRLSKVKGLDCHRPAAGMFMMVDVRGTGLSSTAFAEDLLAAEGVGVLPGDGFGKSVTGFVRVSLALPQAILEEACDRIERFVDARRTC